MSDADWTNLSLQRAQPTCPRAVSVPGCAAGHVAVAHDGVAYDGGSSLRIMHPGGAPTVHPTFQTGFAADSAVHAAWKWCAEERGGEGTAGRVGVVVVLTAPGRHPFALLAAPGPAAALPTAVAGVPVEQVAEAQSSAPGEEEGWWRTATAAWALSSKGPYHVAQVGVCAVGGASTLRVGWLAVGPDPVRALPRPPAQLAAVHDLRAAQAPTLYRIPSSSGSSSSRSGGERDGIQIRCAVAWAVPPGCTHADVYAGGRWVARVHGGWAELDVPLELAADVGQGAEQGAGAGRGTLRLPVRVVCADEAAMPTASDCLDLLIGDRADQ